MTRTLCLSALAASAALLALSQVAPASAAQTTQQACSMQYQAAKSAGTLNGQKWPQFYSDCAAKLNASDDASAAPAATTKKSAAASAKPAATAKQASAGAAMPASASGQQTTQQICSAQYQAAKSAGTLNGQKWPAFLSACSDSIKSYSDQTAAVPDEPQATAQVAPSRSTASMKKMAAAPVSTDGKTPGEIAFQQRIHACATEWQSEKSAGTLPAGSKWPQFWSACNTQLKARM